MNTKVRKKVGIGIMMGGMLMAILVLGLGMKRESELSGGCRAALLKVNKNR